MTVDQLTLDVEAVVPIVAVVRQLHELPGSTWRDIFELAIADADAPISRGDDE